MYRAQNMMVGGTFRRSFNFVDMSRTVTKKSLLVHSWHSICVKKLEAANAWENEIVMRFERQHKQKLIYSQLTINYELKKN
jgi:hypothetical protein